jgi:hypothetical protein
MEASNQKIVGSGGFGIAVFDNQAPQMNHLGVLVRVVPAIKPWTFSSMFDHLSKPALSLGIFKLATFDTAGQMGDTSCFPRSDGQLRLQRCIICWSLHFIPAVPVGRFELLCLGRIGCPEYIADIAQSAKIVHLYSYNLVYTVMFFFYYTVFIYIYVYQTCIIIYYIYIHTYISLFIYFSITHDPFSPTHVYCIFDFNILNIFGFISPLPTVKVSWR